MQGIHIHPHRPDWHTLGTRFGHLIHDPRFWVGFALAVLLGLMVLAVMMGESTGGTSSVPIYPMHPYMP